jgi:predicted permease
MLDWREAVRAHLAAARLDPMREIDLIEELAQHLEDRYGALIASGIEDAEAERAALAELGEPETLAQELERSGLERSRLDGNAVERSGLERRGSEPGRYERTAAARNRARGLADPEIAAGAPAAGPRLGGLWFDLRYAARALRRNPWFAATVVLCLALGIGAASTVFGVVDVLFFRPPSGVGDPGRLVRPYVTARGAQLSLGGAGAMLPDPVFDEIRGQTQAIEGVAGFVTLPISAGLGRTARPIDAQLVTADYFSVLRVRPALGRFFGADEPAPAAVVSFAYWREELGADPSAIGSLLTLNGHLFTIVGVAPEHFRGVDGGGIRIIADFGPRGIWVPFSQSSELGMSSGPGQPRTLLSAIARLAPDATAEQAQAELETIVRRTLRAKYGADVEARLELGPLQFARGPYPLERAKIARWLAVAAALVLAIACANTANLLLTRAAVRRREIGIRLSMGASRVRLVRQLLTESALLAACGAALGLLLARWGAALVPLAGRLPPLRFFADGRVLVFCVAVAVVCVATFGTVPALVATRSDLAGVIKPGMHGAALGRSRARSALMVFQVALAVLLLVGAGFFVHGLRNLLVIDTGMDLENLSTVSVDLESAGYDGDSAARLFEQALDGLRRVPGVREATTVFDPPLSGRTFFRPYSVPDSPLRAEPPPTPLQIMNGAGAIAVLAGPRYFATIGTPILEGRDFSEQDREDSTPVTIVNRTFAEREWPGKSALGRCIDVGTPGTAKCYTVIGIDADAKYVWLSEPQQRAVFFLPLAQTETTRRSLLIRTAVHASGIANGVRAALGELDANLPYIDIQPLSNQLHPWLDTPRLGASLLSAFGVMALVLAAIGLYGVISYTVEQRRHELGIRMALGADARNVLTLVVRQGMMLTLAGLAIGFACSLGAARPLVRHVYDVPATDPLVFVSVGALLAAIGVLASWIPARRAARLDPAVTLRNE